MENNEFNELTKITNGIVVADEFINMNYLLNMDENRVLVPSEDIISTDDIRLFCLDGIVYDKSENINDKLISVYSALQNVGGTMLFIIKSDGYKVSIYIGTKSSTNASTAGLVLKKSFLGNFPGSELTNISNQDANNEDIKDVLDTAFEGDNNSVSSVTVIPSLRDDNKEHFVQGIEKFIDTMQGEKYTAVFISRPAEKKEIERRKRGYEELFSALSPLQKMSLSYGINDSFAVSNGTNDSISSTITNSISKTTGRNIGANYSLTAGSSKGFSFVGTGINRGSSNSESQGYFSGQSWTKAITEGTTEGVTQSISEQITYSNGKSINFSQEHENKSIVAICEKIEQNLKRIKACEAFGMWECSAYFVANDIQTSVVAANAYKALMSGDNTGVENSFINVWDGNRNTEKTQAIINYIKHGEHPITETRQIGSYTSQFVTPGYYLSGKEMTLFQGLPHKSVTGLTVSKIAEFGRNIFNNKKSIGKQSIELGKIFHMGKVEKNPVCLDVNSLASHCFITGSTGCGKSNTVFCMIEKLVEKHIPFLVIEPAKGEYKTTLGKMEGINIFTTNPLVGQMLKINPFKFDPGIHILEHLDRLIEIFNNCWEMYAAMPAILKDAIEQAYISKGWNLTTSLYKDPGRPQYPNFEDLKVALTRVIKESAYSADTKGDYTGALITRINSLTNGIYGQIFCDNYDIPDQILFDSNTIVDLSRVGSSETKSLLMGIIVLKLTEYRLANVEDANRLLRHVTVLEEAHHLLKNVESKNTVSNIISKSVEMICNGIAEMRTYGEGFIIVDQSPSSVDIAAIKNTNTKIIMRLPENNDRDAVGNAVGLNDDQILEISKLSTGVAVVMQNNWIEAVLSKIDIYSNAYERKIEATTYDRLKIADGHIISEMMKQYIVERKMNLDPFVRIIDSCDLPAEKKIQYLMRIRSIIEVLANKRDVEFFCECLINISGCQELFRMIENCLIIDNNGNYTKESLYKWQGKAFEELCYAIEIPPNYINTLMRYLINGMINRDTKIDYLMIYEELYE